MQRSAAPTTSVVSAAHDDLTIRIAALRPQLERFARSISRDEAQVDDLVQASLERALVHRGSWQPGTRLDSWLYRIMQNVWIDECRRRRVRGEVTPVEEAVISVDGELDLYHRLLLLQVGNCIAYLPQPQRRVLRHVVFEGLTYRETAQEMRTSIGTVMSRLSRARRHLEKSMG